MTAIKILQSKGKHAWYVPLIGQEIKAKWIKGKDQPKDQYIPQGIYDGDAYVTDSELTPEQLQLVNDWLSKVEENYKEEEGFEGVVDFKEYEILT